MNAPRNGIEYAKERVSGPRRGSAGQNHAQEAMQARPSGNVLFQLVVVPDRHGSVRQCPWARKLQA